MSKVVSHGACGRQWTQIGNFTGHCSGCHQTFSGIRAFDNHQYMVDGVSYCADPVDAGLEARPDRNLPDVLIWGREGTPPAGIRRGSE